jgi:2-oxoglutarate dehydrogenase E2 component (dihydrolipoamide succinyltransferase)
MAIDVQMPKMGESVQEGTILRWLKQPGDTVERDEIIAEISTDKVDTEIPSPAAGTLIEILAQENETVEVGAIIARLGEPNEVAAGGAAPKAPAADNSDQQKAGDKPSAPAEPQPGEQQVAAGDNGVAEPSAEAGGESSAPEAADAGERTPIQMPKMGESVQEGTILRWLKQPGDTVERDEIIAEISTDKVDTEIPSPAAGTLAEIVAQENETVEVGAVIAYLSSGAAPKKAAAAKPAPAAPQAAKAEAAPAPAVAAKEAPAKEQPVSPWTVSGNGRLEQQQQSAPAEANGPVPRTSGDRFYSPLVRSIATKEGLSVGELDTIQGHGQNGRVTKEDVLGYVKNRPAQRPTAAPEARPAAAKSAPATAPGAKKDYGPDVEVVPMDRMRQLIAEHMVRSKQTSPHVTEVGESDVTTLVRLRESRKTEFEKREGIKLTYTPFFIAAVARALRDNPWVNASVDGTNVIVKKHVNIGVATALPDGNLIVPVIKDADRLNISGIAHAVNDLATRARNKSLTPDEIAGGTFTLTNYGVFGLLHGAPIINQPQVAILGTGAIQKRPVVREIAGQDMIIIRSMVYLSLSHDHRVIDGLLGGKFLADVIKYLESFDENTML